MNSSIRTKKWWSLIILVVFIVMTAGMDAMAKPKTAKQLTSEGAKAFEKEDYDKALSLFNEAYEKEPSTSLLYNLGRVNETKGEFEKAMSYYRDYVTAADADEDARSDALNRIEQLEKIITIKNGGSLTGGNAAGGAKAAPAKAAGGAKSSASKAAAMPAGGCIDVNTADAKTLTQLTGIGDAKAKQIVELRGSGSFKSLDELTSIKGIGPGTVNKFRAQVCPPLGGGDAAAAPAAAPKAAGKAAASKPAKTVKPSETGDVVDI